VTDSERFAEVLAEADTATFLSQFLDRVKLDKDYPTARSRYGRITRRDGKEKTRNVMSHGWCARFLLCSKYSEPKFTWPYLVEWASVIAAAQSKSTMGDLFEEDLPTIYSPTTPQLWQFRVLPAPSPLPPKQRKFNLRGRRLVFSTSNLTSYRIISLKMSSCRVTCKK